MWIWSWENLSLYWGKSEHSLRHCLSLIAEAFEIIKLLSVICLSVRCWFTWEASWHVADGGQARGTGGGQRGGGVNGGRRHLAQVRSVGLLVGPGRRGLRLPRICEDDKWDDSSQHLHNSILKDVFGCDCSLFSQDHSSAFIAQWCLQQWPQKWTLSHTTTKKESLLWKLSGTCCVMFRSKSKRKKVMFCRFCFV